VSETDRLSRLQEIGVHLFGQNVPIANAFFLLLALGLALGFEFVNGFHDTANAVATVISTHTLKPVYAVVWSGLSNLIGVLTSTGLVAFSVVALGAGQEARLISLARKAKSRPCGFAIC
jgi:hypothetical protein